jgi:hypothetical protein
MKSPIGRAEMIRDAKCTRFLVPNRHLQPVITIMKKEKVEKIHINGDQVTIQLDKPIFPQMGKM